MPNEVSGGSSIWLAVIGLVGLIVTALIAPLALEAFKAWAARRNGTPPTPPRGLNTPIDPASPNVTGYKIDGLIATMADMQRHQAETDLKLEKAENKIRQLEQNEDYHEYALDQAIKWGESAIGDPPRPIPEFLRNFLKRDTTP